VRVLSRGCLMRRCWDVGGCVVRVGVWIYRLAVLGYVMGCLSGCNVVVCCLL
jgi:hypothetical protein